MMLLLLHESTGPHVHAGSSALSLWELAGLTILAVAASALLESGAPREFSRGAEIPSGAKSPGSS